MRPRKLLRPTSIQEIAADPIKQARLHANSRLAAIWKEIVTCQDLPAFEFTAPQFEEIWATLPAALVKKALKQALQRECAGDLVNLDTAWLAIFPEHPTTGGDAKCIGEPQELTCLPSPQENLEIFCTYHQLKNSFKTEIERNIKCLIILPKYRSRIEQPKKRGVAANISIRFSVELLAATWWAFLDQEARRSSKPGQFGSMLIPLLEALAAFKVIEFGLGDLSSKAGREEVAKKMLNGIDRTKARGVF